MSREPFRVSYEWRVDAHILRAGNCDVEAVDAEAAIKEARRVVHRMVDRVGLRRWIPCEVFRLQEKVR